MGLCHVGRSVVVGSLALLLSAMVAPAAQATLIPLSTHATGNADPTLFDATLDFAVSGNTLTVTLTNDTTAPNSFLISAIYFNATSNVTSVTPLSLPSGWNFNTGANAGSFGQFDYGVVANNGANTQAVGPGQSQSFTFNLTGSNLNDLNFLTDFSTGKDSMLVAARFIAGPGVGNQGGWGGSNVIPEPGAAALLCCAVVLIGRRGRARFGWRQVHYN